MNPVLGANLAMGGVGLLGGIAGQLTPNAFRERKILREDVQRLREGKLGLSDAEKRRMVGEAQMAASAQQAAQAAQMRQNMAANPQVSGMMQQALQAQAAQAPQLAAQAMSQANQASQSLAESRKADILRRMGGQRAQLSQAFGSTARAVEQPAAQITGMVAGGQTPWEEYIKTLQNTRKV
jgi:hypothetical protein